MILNVDLSISNNCPKQIHYLSARLDGLIVSLSLRSSLRRTLELCLLISASSSATFAQTDVAIFPFTGNSRASTDVDANSSASDFRDGPGFTGSFSSVGNPAPGIETTGNETENSQAAALAGGDFFEWTVTPNAGSAAVFQELTFNAQARAQGSGGMNSRFELFWSGDGYTTPLGAHLETTPANSTSDFTDTHTFTFGPLDAKGETTTFRMLVWDGSNSGNKQNRLDNVTLSASFIDTESTFNVSPTSIDSIVGEAQGGGPTPDYYANDGSSAVGVGGPNGSRTNRNPVLGFELPTLDGDFLSATLTLTKNGGNNDIDVDLYGLGTTNPDGSGTSFFLENDTDANVANQKLLDEFFFSGDADGVTRVADVSDFIAALYSGENPLQTEAFFRLNPDEDIGFGIERSNFDLSGASLSITTTATAAVPEPASIAVWSLLALGLGGFGYYRTRRKNKA